MEHVLNQLNYTANKTKEVDEQFLSAASVLLYVVNNSDQDMNTRNDRSKPRAHRVRKKNELRVLLNLLMEETIWNFIQKKETE